MSFKVLVRVFNPRALPAWPVLSSVGLGKYIIVYSILIQNVKHILTSEIGQIAVLDATFSKKCVTTDL